MLQYVLCGIRALVLDSLHWSHCSNAGGNMSHPPHPPKKCHHSNNKTNQPRNPNPTTTAKKPNQQTQTENQEKLRELSGHRLARVDKGVSGITVFFIPCNSSSIWEENYFLDNSQESQMLFILFNFPCCMCAGQKGCILLNSSWQLVLARWYNSNVLYNFTTVQCVATISGFNTKCRLATQDYCDVQGYVYNSMCFGECKNPNHKPCAGVLGTVFVSKCGEHMNVKCKRRFANSWYLSCFSASICLSTGCLLRHSFHPPAQMLLYHL